MDSLLYKSYKKKPSIRSPWKKDDRAGEMWLRWKSDKNILYDRQIVTGHVFVPEINDPDH